MVLFVNFGLVAATKCPIADRKNWQPGDLDTHILNGLWASPHGGACRVGWRYDRKIADSRDINRNVNRDLAKKIPLIGSE